jgi:hypothetical protein
MKERQMGTEGGYGANDADAARGYTNEGTAKKDSDGFESWVKKYDEEQAYRNIGFGRDTGNAR